MRDDLDRVVTELAADDERVRMVVADLGSFRTFRARFPGRFINVGVAEANAAGIAAGLASEGLRVFLFSVAGFVLYRALEHLKFSIGAWNQPVCLVGSGFGWQYHRIGRGHHAADDLALMGTVPNMRVLAPIDSASLPALLAGEPTGPVYLRLGSGLPNTLPASLDPCAAEVVVVAPGEMAKRCARAVDVVREEGIAVALVGLERFTVSEVRACLAGARRVVVVEDHVATGGLGTLVREAGLPVVAHLHAPVLLQEHVTVSEEALAESCGLNTRSIADCIRSALRPR